MLRSVFSNIVFLLTGTMRTSKTSNITEGAWRQRHPLRRSLWHASHLQLKRDCSCSLVSLTLHHSPAMPCLVPHSLLSMMRCRLCLPLLKQSTLPIRPRLVPGCQDIESPPRLGWYHGHIISRVEHFFRHDHKHPGLVMLSTDKRAILWARSRGTNLLLSSFSSGLSSSHTHN